MPNQFLGLIGIPQLPHPLCQSLSSGYWRLVKKFRFPAGARLRIVDAGWNKFVTAITIFI